MMRARAGVLRVDGGAARNDSLLQFQADLLGVPGGAAGGDRDDRGGRGLPGRARGGGLVRTSTRSRRRGRSIGDSSHRWTGPTRDRLLSGWRRAVERSLRWAVEPEA